jgi:hypothetical protein
LQKLICLITLLLAMFAPAAMGAVVASGHPILGTWKFDMPDGSCSEIYRFRSDGTTIVTSGEEVAESSYSIAASASKDGFYKWVDTIVKDNGKKDCTGEITKPGKAITNFVQFDGSGELLIVCREETAKACFGPLRRVHGDAI